MARIVIERIESPRDLIEVARELLGLLSRGDLSDMLAADTVRMFRREEDESELERIWEAEPDYSCRVTFHRPGCSCEYDRAHIDPRQSRAYDVARSHGPVPYIPCAARGTHARLADCWMCWCDEHRGAFSAADANVGA